MKLALSMGRTRSEMRDKVASTQEVVQEHIWKLYAYHSIRQSDVAGWLESINKYLPTLHTYNIAKKHATRLNLDRAALEDAFVTTLFEDRDTDALNLIWSQRGFPKLPLCAKNYKGLRMLARRFVQCIIDSTQFTVDAKDLY